MSRYVYAKIEDGCIKIPQEMLSRFDIMDNSIVEISQIGETDLQISFVEDFCCPYGYTKTQERCYKCACYEGCKRTERVQKLHL